jgi:hypothetical protein
LQYNLFNLFCFVLILILLLIGNSRKINTIVFSFIVTIAIILRPFGISPDDYEYLSRISVGASISELFTVGVLSEPIFYLISSIIKFLIKEDVFVLKVIEVLSALISILFLSNLPKYKVSFIFYYGVIMPVQTMVLIRTGISLAFAMGYVMYLVNSRKIHSYIFYILSFLSHKQALFLPIVTIGINPVSYLVKRNIYFIVLILFIILSYSSWVTIFVDYLITHLEINQLKYYYDLSDGTIFNIEPGVGMRSWVLFMAVILCSMQKNEYKNNLYLQYALTGILFSIIILTCLSPIPVIARRFFEFYSFFAIFISQSKSKLTISTLLIFIFVNYIIELFLFPLSNYYEYI